MKLNGKELIFGAIGVSIIVLLGLILWQHHENDPQVQAEKASKAASISQKKAENELKKQVNAAPKGRYVHLTKDSDTLYKTSWSKQEFFKYVKDTPLNDDTETDFGTKKNFTQSSDDVSSIVGSIYDDTDMFKQNDQQDKRYNLYFDAVSDAMKDPDVKHHVKNIVY